MHLKRLLVLFLAVSALFGCAHYNQYANDDAALVHVLCKVQTRSPAGKDYRVYSTINEVDGSFIWAGPICPNDLTYRVEPGFRRLTVIPNLESNDSHGLLYTTVEVTAELLPYERYELLTGFDGSAMTIGVLELSTGKIAGTGQSTDIKYSSGGNPALDALPIILMLK